jgi:hypothetical protein
LLLSYKTVLFDLRDYSKRSHSDLEKDLKTIENLWREVCSEVTKLRRQHPDENIYPNIADPYPNFVVFIQQELDAGHFYLSKSSFHLLSTPNIQKLWLQLSLAYIIITEWIIKMTPLKSTTSYLCSNVL